MPNAPSLIPCSTSATIVWISSGVALRSTSPMTALRTDPWPTKLPMLIDVFSASIWARNGASGSGDDPSGPSMTVVTPWRA